MGGRVAIGVAAKHIGKKAAKKVIIQETKKKAVKAAKKKIAKRNKKLKEMGRQPIKGATEHFWQRMKERGFSYNEINRTLLEGKYLGKSGSGNHVYRLDKLNIFIDKKGKLRTGYYSQSKPNL